jgi:hypothetical protein
MYTSSEEYIKALHEGDILKFLEWPKWLTEHSLNQDYTLDADATLDLLHKEWLRVGYTEKDTTQMAIVFSLLYEPNSLLQSIYEYSASALCGAASQCMVYQKILTQKTPLSLDASLNPYQKNSQLLAESDKTLSVLGNQQIEAIKVAKMQLRNILLMREMVSSYLTFIKQPQHENDTNLALRRGLAQNLNDALERRTKYDDACRNEIEAYVTKLRKLSPTATEETEYLSYMISVKKPQNLFWESINWGCNFLFFNQEETPNKDTILAIDNEPFQNPNPP